jgi:hypothetical protein
MLKDQHMHFGFVDVILLQSGHCHVAATCCHHQGGENWKHTDIFKICQNHSSAYKS